MFRTVLMGTCLAIMIGACASSDSSPEDAPVTETADSTRYSLAIGTVNALERAGNEHVAIDRLTLLLGDPGMSDMEMAEVLYRRAELRLGEGNDVEGAITDLKEILSDYPGTPNADDASALLAEASQERDMLTGMLDGDAISPMERFEILFRLGRHQDAADIMLAGSLKPDMKYIRDMYQIGYLCDGDELAGPVYLIAEGTDDERALQFCDLYK
ncbi:tetratricopeptide repeat protein [Henriciella litoralis]|uniref:tetratricopeptide repeat protein n=1 Tax=Henriciella litoralis TaxID=568102 RepID=UPI00111BD134|nr:hypothetical protein [Henriciella litoralis]